MKDEALLSARCRDRWTSLVGCEYVTPQTSFGKSMSPRPAEIGDRIADIESPTLSVDLDALNRKIVRMAKCAPSTGRRVRAHAKIRKSMLLASEISAPAASMALDPDNTSN
jgi:hypothetical protein